MKIESFDQDIRTVLPSEYYRIPRFRRPYSWTQEHIQEFWDDVVRYDPSEYFIGSMVVFREGNQRYGVVGGQRRLTTIVIFLATLKNALATFKHEDLANGIQGLIERKNILSFATKPGNWVLDSFAGSGPTGAAAHKMGRR